MPWIRSSTWIVSNVDSARRLLQEHLSTISMTNQRANLAIRWELWVFRSRFPNKKYSILPFWDPLLQKWEEESKNSLSLETLNLKESPFQNSLEKCTACNRPISDKLLRACGGVYHVNCFVCYSCKKSLDGIPFTLDKDNNVHCVPCFHEWVFFFMRERWNM